MNRKLNQGCTDWAFLMPKIRRILNNKGGFL